MATTVDDRCGNRVPVHSEANAEITIPQKYTIQIEYFEQNTLTSYQKVK